VADCCRQCGAGTRGARPFGQGEGRPHYVDLVGLSDYIDAYPKQLSGGMAQRAAIARALVSEPNILLMDEPFGALDSLLRLRLQDELLRIWDRNNISIVIVTHDIEEALYLGDRVIILEANPGRIHSVIDVGLDRPRLRDDPHMASLKRQCLELVLEPSARVSS
jgi:sulfonate transport system ATP-binding protein